ncbi:MAG: TRAP transporter large permease [Betaproteobacteria bacterium]|jgi:tripartite ATP-independent transporter DctM subunit
MEPIYIGYIALAALLGLLALGVPISWSVGIIGVLGSFYLNGVNQTASQIVLTVWENGTLFVFIVLPLFLLMGQLSFHTGIANDLYDCIHKWFGHLPGGLAVAAVIANAIYGAVTGNSVAAVATMGPMVMPQFRKYKYNLSLATGTLASAGTLAVLVPPSTLLTIYGLWTETSIGELFTAGIIPCILIAFAYCLVLMIWCIVKPEMGPKGPVYSWSERISSLKQLLPTMVVMFMVLGGIYGGIVTPAEASGIGVAGVMIVAGLTGRLTKKAVVDSFRAAATTSGMVFTILITGIVFSRFLVQTQVTSSILEWISAMQLSKVHVLMAILVFYFILGTALDTFGMLILSLPFVMPIVDAYNIDKVWFGVFVGVMVELAAVSPPVGITVAVMRAVAPDVSTTDIFKGCYPFLILTLLLGVALIVWPDIALWLPRTLR